MIDLVRGMKRQGFEVVVVDDGNAGSHFHVLRDSWRIYREILKFSLSSLLGFVVDYTLYSVLSLLGDVPLTANIAARGI